MTTSASLDAADLPTAPIPVVVTPGQYPDSTLAPPPLGPPAPLGSPAAYRSPPPYGPVRGANRGDIDAPRPRVAGLPRPGEGFSSRLGEFRRHFALPGLSGPAGHRQRSKLSGIGQPAGLPARQPRSPWHAVTIPMATVSVLAVWLVLYAMVLGTVQEHRSQNELRSAFQKQLALQTAPVSDPISRGAPVALLAIPAVGLHNVVVVEGTNSADLEAGPGHRRDTVLPGQAGVSVLVGRSALFAAPFGHIVDLRPGNQIAVVTGQGSFRYRVTDVRRNGDPLPYPIARGSARLTLVTSVGHGGGLLPSRQTLYVDATLNGPAQAPDTGRPTAVADSEAPMRGDVASLAVLVSWLLALVVALVVAAWARTNWGLVPTLLVTLPVLVAALWVITELAAQLLPNLV